jgi:hypothetical protein
MNHLVYMQKNGIVITQIASYLLSCKPGDRICSVREFSKMFNVGHGTVQLALDYLEKSEACAIMKNGNKGSFLVGLDAVRLMKAAGVNSINGVMGIPYVNWYIGLAMGVESALSNNILETYIALLPGSINRVNALLEGRYDFAIVPTDFLQTIGDKNQLIEVVADIDNQELIERNSVIALKSNNLADLKLPRLGVDFTSQQHLFLSRKYYEEHQVAIVPLYFSSLKAALLNGEIDLAIVEGQLTDTETDFVVVDQLSAWQMVIYKREALIVRKDNLVFKHFIRSYLDINQVLKVQRSTAQGEGIVYPFKRY